MLPQQAVLLRDMTVQRADLPQDVDVPCPSPAADALAATTNSAERPPRPLSAGWMCPGSAAAWSVRTGGSGAYFEMTMPVLG
jgi:hypothetical protein